MCENTCGPTLTHESNNNNKIQAPMCIATQACTQEYIGYPAHKGMCSVEHFEPYSIISVLGCQRLWERATAHSSGSSQCLLQKPMRFIIKTRAPVSGTLWTDGKLSWPWFNILYPLLKSFFFLFLPWAHFTNSKVDSQGTLSLSQRRCHRKWAKLT